MTRGIWRRARARAQRLLVSHECAMIHFVRRVTALCASVLCLCALRVYVYVVVSPRVCVCISQMTQTRRNCTPPHSQSPLGNTNKSVQGSVQAPPVSAVRWQIKPASVPAANSPGERDARARKAHARIPRWRCRRRSFFPRTSEASYSDQFYLQTNIL